MWFIFILACLAVALLALLQRQTGGSGCGSGEDPGGSGGTDGTWMGNGAGSFCSGTGGIRNVWI